MYVKHPYFTYVTENPHLTCMPSSLQLGRVKQVTHMGHTATARIAARPAAVPQLAGGIFYCGLKRHKSSSPCKAPTSWLLNTFNGDDPASPWAVTRCSHRAGADGGWVTRSARRFLQPQRTRNRLLRVLAHAAIRSKLFWLLSFIHPEEKWAYRLQSTFLLQTLSIFLSVNFSIYKSRYLYVSRNL